MVLRVTILGAGIGGLTAALALRQCGHHVVLLEKSSFSNDVLGNAICIAPNCAGILERLSIDVMDAGANVAHGFQSYKHTGEVQITSNMSELAKEWRYPWRLVHRGDLHLLLRERTLQDAEEGWGTVRLVLSCNVVKIDSESGRVETADGDIFDSDLVVGADGVRSFARSVVAPGMELKYFGKCFYRWLVKKETLANVPELRNFLKEAGTYMEITSQDRKILMYPCRRNTMMNCAAVIPDKENQDVGADWNQGADKEKLLAAFEKYYPPARALLQSAGDDLRTYRLFDMDPLPSWTNGRVVLLGDAAHPFLPFLAQGAAQAIEDAGCLGRILSSNPSCDQIPQLLKTYENIRKLRVEYIQEQTRLNGRDEGKGRPSPQDVMKLVDQLYKFDEWEHTEQVLQGMSQPDSKAPAFASVLAT